MYVFKSFYSNIILHEKIIIALRFLSNNNWLKKIKFWHSLNSETLDNLKWHKLFDILRKIEIIFKERRAILNLYIEQKAIISVEGEEGEAKKIEKNVKQNCSLSPILFNF